MKYTHLKYVLIFPELLQEENHKPLLVANHSRLSYETLTEYLGGGGGGGGGGIGGGGIGGGGIGGVGVSGGGCVGGVGSVGGVGGGGG